MISFSNHYDVTRIEVFSCAKADLTSGVGKWMKFMAWINATRCKVTQLTSTLNKKSFELHM